MADTEEDMEMSSSVVSGPQMLLRILVAPYTAKKQVSVLILTPRWKYDLCGKSNITKSFIKILRNIDPEAKFIRITCAVLEEEGQVERIKEAEDLKVKLKGYIHPRARGKKGRANPQWLNDYAVTYYQHVVSEINYDFIIGHTPYFTDGCLNLRDSRRDSEHTPKAVLIVHELPQLDTGETDEALLRDWLCEAEVVFSMEKSIRDEITRQIGILEEEKAPLHKDYIPGYPIEFFEINREELRKSESERETEIMMITPMKKGEMKGYDFSLAVNAVSIACMESKRTTVTMLTANISDKEEWEKEYRNVLKAGNQDLTFKCERVEDIEELKFYIRKSDLFLFPLQESSSLFGEEALAAVASGVPILVSSHSGVASFLLEMNENGSIVASMDERLWAERIIQKIKNPADTTGLKERLLLDTTIASIHQDFTKVICDVGCAEIEIKMVTEEYVPETAIEIAKRIGLTDIGDPESYLLSFFEKTLYLRDKLEKGLLEKYLGKPLQEKWKRLFSSLEEGQRRLLSVRRGSIIVNLFCPTEDSFEQISNDTWRKKVSKRFEELLEVLGFKNPQCTFNDYNCDPQPSEYQDQVSALLLTTRWLFDFTDITTVTRSLISNLRHHDPKGENVRITCAILEEDRGVEKEQINNAKEQNVTLRGAVPPVGDTLVIPETQWMNKLSAAYYHSVFNQGPYNFIVGHAPLFSYGAVNLKDLYKGKPVPKVVLVIHELPKTKQGLERETLDRWIRGTDIVFSIGEAAKNELERFLFGKKHELYIPIYALKDVSSDVKSTVETHGYQVTLMVGRKERDHNGIDLRLAICATRSAAKIIHKEGANRGVHLVLIGEDKTDEEHLKTSFRDTDKKEGILSFNFVTSQSSEETHSRIIGSSVFLLPLKSNCSKFGVEALTAAAAGVPILVSQNSGMAALLEEMGEGEHTVVRRKRDFDLDVKAWKEKIVEKIANYQQVQNQTERIRQTLLKNRNIAATHLNFMSTIFPTQDMCSVEEYVEANYRRMTGSENSKGVPRNRWKRVDFGDGPEKATKENPLRRAKYRERKRQSSQDAIINGKRKLQKMNSYMNTVEGSQKDILELTDERLHKLSTEITKESDLRKLGLGGLHLKAKDIDAHISNYPSDIVTAAYYTLKYWRASQADHIIAYETLCQALRDAEMGLKIYEALR